LFRRSKPDSATPAEEPGTPAGASARPQGKGRPTPTRREAEAAARARAKAAASAPASRKDARRLNAERSRTIRQGIRDGDERYLPARDKGPVRRFVRDFVDARLSMAELAVPGFILSFLVSAVGSQALGSGLLNALLLVIVVDSVLLRFRLRRELRNRFPDESLKGTTYYAVTRAMQMKFMRLPKAQVKIGQQLPEHYR